MLIAIEIIFILGVLLCVLVWLLFPQESDDRLAFWLDRRRVKARRVVAM
jgi:hypothetical protein